MKIKRGKGSTGYGPGTSIKLTADDVAIAIDAYLVAHDITVVGHRTIRVNGDILRKGSVYVDPTGYVIASGELVSFKTKSVRKGQ